MIVVTGATGRTGQQVAKVLLSKGRKVRALGRDAGRLEPLSRLGAQAFAGSVTDSQFLMEAFDGASAIYLVLPEDMSQPDLRIHQERVSDCYAKAVAKSPAKFVVNLSSIGAQNAQGTGPIVGLHNQEQKLNGIDGLSVLHLRAAYFMENLFMSMAPIRATGTMPGGMPGNVFMPWIATKDIGTYAAGRLESRDFSGSSIQELHGQRDISMNEAAAIVGKAIGRQDIRYAQVPLSALESVLLDMGLPGKNAKLIVEMWNGANAGLIVPQQERSSRNTTTTTLESFVAESFAPAYLSAT